MRLYEHEAKRVLADEGIRIPRRFALVRSAAALKKRRIRCPAMVKAQVLVGGRGKAGGVRKIASPREAAPAAESILSMRIGGYRIAGVLIEEALEFTAGCYLGVTVNPATFNSVIMVSPTGGVDIEEVARERPESVMRMELPEDPEVLPPEIAEKLSEFLCTDPGVPDDSRESLCEVIAGVYRAYQNCDCKVVEINPLLITARGPVAADAKIVLDDNALFRQTKLLERLKIAAKRHEVAEPTTRERRATEAGFPYVDLLDEEARREPGKTYVGLVPGGAGYGIFSIDETMGIGEDFFSGRAVPVNFMDSGGGPTRQRVAEMFSLLMDYPLVDLIVTSRFGGISSCDVFIRGLVDCLRIRRTQKKRVVPVYGRMVGTDLAAARTYLEAARRETPEALESLSMIVGNRKVMADVIKDALDEYLTRREETTG